MAFIKILSTYQINSGVEKLSVETYQIPRDLDRFTLISREIFKMIMNQTSLKTLDRYVYESDYIRNVSCLTYLGAMNCLRNLSELRCGSELPVGFLRWLSEYCHHLQTLRITIQHVISDGLSELISVQWI